MAIRDLRRVLGDRARPPSLSRRCTVGGIGSLPPVAVAEPSHERHQTAGTWRLPQPVARVQSALFVGREGELAQMYQWLAQALQGRRQVGIIAGEPGIGKTALVNTFVAQVAAVEPLMVGHGQCVESYGAGEPYLPVLEALGRLCRGPEGTRLVAVLRQYAPSWLVQMPALLPPAEWEALQRTVGTTAQTRMLRELTEALDAFTTERPLVLVLEDLHWSDRATLEWLAYVARRPDPARLLILGTYRPVEAIVHAHPLRTVPHRAPAARAVCGVGAGLSVRGRGRGLPPPAVRGRTAGSRPGARAASAHQWESPVPDRHGRRARPPAGGDARDQTGGTCGQGWRRSPPWSRRLSGR